MINNNQYDHYLSCHDICLSKVTRGQIQMCKKFILSDQKIKKNKKSTSHTHAHAQIHTLPGSLGVCGPEQFLHGPTKEHEKEKNEMHNRSSA